MVRPVSFKGFQKGFQGVSLRGFRGFQIFLWELCVCIKYLSLGELAYVNGGMDDATKEYLIKQLNAEEKIAYKASGYSDLWLLMNLKEQVGEGRMPEHYFAWAEQQLEEYLGKPVD